MLPQQTYNSRNYIVGHPNIVSPKNLVSPYRQSQNVITSPINTQSHIVHGGLHHPNNYSHQQLIQQERSSHGLTRLSNDQIIVSGFFVSSQGERACDFKIVGEDFMRIKDIASEYCYKFRVTPNIPSIQLHPTCNFRLLLSFSGDYIEDLHRFIGALEDYRFSIRSGERSAILEFRFNSLEDKNQLIELIHSLSRRVSLTHVQTAPTLANYKSMSSILNHQQIQHIQPQPVTIQTINQGHISDRSNVERVQHLNANQIPDVGVTAFKRLDVPPPVPLVSFPVPTVVQQETVTTQQQPVIVTQQTGANRASLQATQILRLTEQNRVLNSTLLSIQQQSQLLIQQNTRLYVQINNLKQQIQIFKSQSSSKTHYNEGETIRLKNQLLKATQNIANIQKNLRQTQLLLSQSKASQVQVKNESESSRINLIKQISELQTRINTLNGASTGSSTQIASLRRQYDEQKNSNIHLQTQLGKLQQLLGEAEKRLLEYEVGFQEVRQQISITFDEERNHLNNIIESKNQQVAFLNNKLNELRLNTQQPVTVTQIVNTNTNEIPAEFQAERQNMIQDIRNLEIELQSQQQWFDNRIIQLTNQVNQKVEVIQRLEMELNNNIHSHDISITNNNLEAVDRMRNHYEQQLSNTKQLYENEYHQLNQQIVHYQKLSEEYQQKFSGLLEEFQRVTGQTHTEFAPSQKDEEIVMLRNHIYGLEQQRQYLIGTLEQYKIELANRDQGINTHQSYVLGSSQEGHAGQYITQKVTETVYQYPQSNTVEIETHHQGRNEDSVERVTYKIGNENEVVQTLTYKTEVQGEGIVQVESLERITHGNKTGEEQIESIERVTLQEAEGEQTKITTYELDDGEERYIHKITTESLEGKTVHQLDTNIVVHREEGELVYDIDTEETTYEGGERYTVNSSGEQPAYQNQLGYQYQTQNYGQQQYGYQQAASSQSSQVSQGYNTQQNVIYHGNNVDVRYGNRGNNIVIEGGDYKINVPQGTSGIKVTEQTYTEVNRPYYR